MACKDCIHYDICLIRDELSDGESKVVSVLECENFKDRARFVELPCKVGDKVYCGSFGKIMEDEIKCIIIDVDETRMILKRGISYDIDMINQMFFFTKESAEQALKEREENAN